MPGQGDTEAVTGCDAVRFPQSSYHGVVLEIFGLRPLVRRGSLVGS